MAMPRCFCSLNEPECLIVSAHLQMANFVLSGMVVDSSEPSTVYDNVEIRMVKERKYEVFSSSSSNNMQQTCPSNNKTILAGVHSLTRDHSSR
ncbi:Os08g0542800 [Oryza sativa Japonica Group]|uniref:Os08g0542800 protein n=1 Tax=Oryza sativa subsp. japonica TaxID=39947 RepID=Q0J406_ORYSJ|nr:Os08g0542800 [Oryza sativa Japonica Group]|eukprot:NP_001062395.1 Os08g0542800 [Oryza sativa Japonica Group]